MNRSIIGVLEWYRDKCLALNSVMRNKNKLDKEAKIIINELVLDGGIKAQDGLDALEVNSESVKQFISLLNSIDNSIKLSCNIKYSEEERVLFSRNTELYMKQVIEVYSSLVSKTVLEMRDDLSKVISNATSELVNEISCKNPKKCKMNDSNLCLKCIRCKDLNKER